jgi:MFS family permease
MNVLTARFGAIALLLLTGILAGAQLAKIAPLVDWYRAEAGFSLVTIGWLTSAIGLFIALGALPAGWAVARVGARRSFLAGAAALVAGGLPLAAVLAPVLILGSRLIEAVGYLILVIALPSILTRISPGHWRAPVLAIWSGFVPLGYASSDFLAAALLPSAGPRIFLVAVILAFAAVALAGLITLRRVPDWDGEIESGGFRQTLTLPVLLVAAAFGAFVVLSLALFAFLPAFVAGAGAHLLLPAGGIALTVPLGNVLTSFLVRGRRAGFMLSLAAGGFALSALCALPAVTSPDPLLATPAAVLLAVSGAVVASALFAAIPFILPAGGSVSVAIGLVSQAGGIATLFGPPLAGWVIERFGWPGLGWFLVFAALFGLLSLAPLVARRR